MLLDALRRYAAFVGELLHGMTPGQILLMFLPCLLIDVPRFVLSKYILLIWDTVRDAVDFMLPQQQDTTPQELPLVSVIVPGLNEEEGMVHTIRSLLENDYPRLEIIVVDDGSSDGTYDVCLPYARRGQIRLFRKNIPGGKTSAANLGLQAARGEIVVIVDSDTSFDREAIANIVRPFADASVGAVSGNIRVRNWRESWLARFQAAEYLHCIFLGRRLHSALGTLNLASGAFGAFRRTALLAVGGWDVGPGEDGDLTTKIRKRGYRIRFAPDAVCLTDAPSTLRGFIKQRLRWSRGVVRYRLRKHVDLANPFQANFRWTNLLVVADALVFRIVLPFSFILYFLGVLLLRPKLLLPVMGLTWCVYAFFNLAQVPLVLYYSRRRLEDSRILLTTMVMSPYNILHRAVRVAAMVQEIVWRSSYTDPYVPQRVREQTIHW